VVGLQFLFFFLRDQALKPAGFNAKLHKPYRYRELWGL
jgi:hypothetical protein